MNKTELVAALADAADLTKADAERAINALQDIVTERVAKGGEKITIPGFLSFEQTTRAARTARNPQTGAPIQVPATKAVKISVGAKLKKAAKGA